MRVVTNIKRQMIEQLLCDTPPAFDLDFPEAEAKDAAVLLLFAEQGNNLHILLTKRAEHLRLHAGQVSLPGGKIDQDDRDEFGTALREANEEIGLDAEDVEKLGYGLPVLTSSNYRVGVAVAFAKMPADQLLEKLQPNGDEVSAIWWGDAQHLLDKSKFSRHLRDTKNGPRPFYVIADTEPIVWGATAAILYRLAKKMNKDTML